MISARGAGNGDLRRVPEHAGQHGTGEPPKENERRPFGEPFVFTESQPDPGKVCDAVTHGHPQEYPEHTAALYGTRMRQQMKDAVIDKKVQHAAAQREQQRQFSFAQKQQHTK